MKPPKNLRQAFLTVESAPDASSRLAHAKAALSYVKSVRIWPFWWGNKREYLASFHDAIGLSMAELAQGDLAILQQVIEHLEFSHDVYAHRRELPSVGRLAALSWAYIQVGAGHSLEKKERALGYARKAEEIAKELGDPGALTCALEKVVEAEGAAPDPDFVEALNAAGASLSIARTYMSKDAVAPSMLQFGQCHLAAALTCPVLSQVEHIEIAIENITQGLGQLTDDAPIDQHVSGHVSKAHAYMKRPLAANTENENIARAACETAIGLSRQAGRRDLASAVQIELANILAQSETNRSRREAMQIYDEQLLDCDEQGNSQAYFRIQINRAMTLDVLSGTAKEEVRNG